MSKRIGWSVAFFAVAFGLASAARADIIMYTESFQATGTLARKGSPINRSR